MPVFRDSDQLYRVLGAFFERVMARPELEDAFVAGGFVLRFRYRDPEGQITIDLRQKPVRWQFGETTLAPDLEMIQSADVAHQFWLGLLNVPAALATRKVVARGPVTKALKLLPAVKPTFPLYEVTLRDLGLDDLVPERGARRTRTLVGRARSLLHRRDPSPAAGSGPPSPPLPVMLLEDGAPEPAAPSFRREAAPPSEERALRVEMLRRMLLVRAFEEKLAEANARGDVPTEAIHLCVGQEATAVGACFALRIDDFMATTHRGHGHMLAKGADLDGMMAEILGKAAGLCGGKGGSMHVTEAAVGAIGANGIVGASSLLAAGAAHSAKLRRSGQVALAFFGDGATNQGMFHEAMNFASVLELPTVFVVENNLYGEFTPIGEHTRVIRLVDRAAAYGMPSESVDGNDVWAVYQVVRRAVERARRGEGPTFVEARTYRWRGHMEGEPTGYRTDEELRAWKERCPIAAFRAVLAASGEVPASTADDLAREARDRVGAAYQRARASTEPDLATLTADVFAPDPGRLWRRTAARGGGRELSYSKAVHEALAEALARDDRVYLLGEDVRAGGYFAVTAGLVERFGRERIVDTPISEYAIVGSAVGAAMTGMRPVAEILFSDFLTTCMDPLVNHAAKLRYMASGQYTVPLVVRTPGGAGLGMAAQHSQSLEALFTGIPGLVVVAPATPYDAKGLLNAAIRSNNPVVFFENKLLYTVTGRVPEEEYLVPLGTADVKRKGADVTVATVGAALGKALDAAEILASEGVEIEVVDLRTLVPLDVPTLVDSVRKTGHLVTVEDGALGHGFGSEVVARVVESAFASMRAPPRRVAGLDVPIPYNSRLENAALPDAERVAEAVRRLSRER